MIINNPSAALNLLKDLWKLYLIAEIYYWEVYTLKSAAQEIKIALGFASLEVNIALQTTLENTG